MELVLKNKCIYFPTNDYVITNKAVFNVKILDQLDSEQYTTSYNLNGVSRIFKDTFVIDKSDLKSNTLNLTITISTPYSNYTYKADDVPVTRAVILGQSASVLYPETIKSLLVRVANLENSDKETKGAIRQANKNISDLNINMNLALHAIKELSEEGEVV